MPPCPAPTAPAPLTPEPVALLPGGLPRPGCRRLHHPSLGDWQPGKSEQRHYWVIRHLHDLLELRRRPLQRAGRPRRLHDLAARHRRLRDLK